MTSLTTNTGPEEGGKEWRGVLVRLGHAIVLVQMRGGDVTSDPLFSQCCSPVQFMGPQIEVRGGRGGGGMDHTGCLGEGVVLC